MPPVFPRRVAIAILMAIGCAFAGNHVAARVAFDHDTGLLVAVLCRSGLTFLVLTALVLWQRESLRLPEGTGPWQLLLGLLIAVQSLCLYSAVARIPVALALLISNTFPLLLALVNWVLGGPLPSHRTRWIMGLILIGLTLVLDLPARLSGMAGSDPRWWAGVGFAFAAASVFALGLWITENRLKPLRGSVRSMLTVGIVFLSMLLAGASGLVPGGMRWPHDAPGWTGLALLTLLYGFAFSVMFVTLPRLNMAENAPAMNIEPVATLFLGWWILQQSLAPIQIAGALVVVGGIVWLGWRRAG